MNEMIVCHVGGTILTGDTRVFKENSIPLLLSEPQIPHRLEIICYLFNALINNAAFVTLHRTGVLMLINIMARYGHHTSKCS